eukprot:jgi/Chlat1/9156/Chrsp97S08403
MSGEAEAPTVSQSSEQVERMAVGRPPDSATAEWQLRLPTGMAPDERTYHTAVARSGRVYIFGGFPSFPSFAKWTLGAGGGDMAKNDMYVYDFETSKWGRITGTGDVPSGRHGHTTVVYNDKMYLFGGYFAGSSTNELHVFNFETSQWTALKPEGALPPPRWRHSAVLYNSCMYIFGGNTRSSDSKNMADLYCYDIEQNSWRQVVCEGDAPAARHDHSAAVIGHWMYVFGGNDGGRKDVHPVNDLHAFCFGSGMWHAVQPQAQGPCPRFAHTAVAVGDSMLIFGGDAGKQKLADVYRYIQHDKGSAA